MQVRYILFQLAARSPCCAFDSTMACQLSPPPTLYTFRLRLFGPLPLSCSAAECLAACALERPASNVPRQAPARAASPGGTDEEISSCRTREGGLRRLSAQAADDATALEGHPHIAADAGLGRDRGGCGSVYRCHDSRVVFSHNNRVPSQHGCPSPSIFPAAREANSTDRRRRSSRILPCPLPRHVAEESRVLDGPALQIYANFACFFLPIILFLRAISAACIVHTMSAASSVRRQSALKWLNRRQPLLRRMVLFVAFAFFITAAPMRAEGFRVGLQYHTCAVSSGGAVSCWGNNEYGQVMLLAVFCVV
jgi:hypothetical protein